MASILIAGAIIAFLVIICVVLVSINNNQRYKMAMELATRFDEFGERHNLSFSDKEILENFTIGLDELRKKLIVVRNAGNEYDRQVVDLKEVKSCSRKRIYKRVDMGTSKTPRYESHIDKIVLEFDYIDKREPLSISFYEALEDHLLPMIELEQKAESWEIILKKTIDKNPIFHDRSK